MMTRDNQPMSNSYSAPTSNEDASDCRPSKVTPSVIARRPQSDVWMRTEAVDADPLNPPDDDLGSADTTSQRTLSTEIESNSGPNITPTPNTTKSRNTTQYNHRALGFFVFFGVAGLPMVCTFLICVFHHHPPVWRPVDGTEAPPPKPSIAPLTNPQTLLRPASNLRSPPQRRARQSRSTSYSATGSSTQARPQLCRRALKLLQATAKTDTVR